MDLSIEAKLLWGYLCDKCDNAGVIDLSKRHAKFSLGIDNDIDKLLKELSKNILLLSNGKLFLHSFIEFQFGQLSEASNLHKNIITLLKKHSLYDKYFKGSLRVNIPLIKGTSKGKGKGNDNEYKSKKVIKEIPTLSEFLEYAEVTCEKAKLNFNELSFAIESKYETWVADGWKDGHGVKIKNWKNKINNTLPYLKPIKKYITESTEIPDMDK